MRRVLVALLVLVAADAIGGRAYNPDLG